MRTMIFATAATLAAVAMPSLAHAQDAQPEAFVGLSAGYHDLGVDDEVQAAVVGLEIDDAAFIGGVFGGVDFPIGSNLFVGLEGNFHLGTGAIDSEYGASVRLGLRDAGGAKYYVRGGYQVVDIDPYEIVNNAVPAGTFDGFDDTADDFMVGVGADFPLGGNTSLRVNLDTVSFDSVRGTGGIAFRF